MILAATTIVLWGPEPDPHTIRLRDLTFLSDFATVPGGGATISLKGFATLRAGVSMQAAATVSIGATGTRVNVKSPLAAAATIAITCQPGLPLANPLKASATIPFSISAPLTIYPLLRASPTITVSSVPPNLFTGAARLRASPTITLATNAPFLSRTQQFFAASPAFHVATTANLRVVGQSATDVFITYNGSPTFNVRLGSITIDDVLNEAPNTCTFIVDQRDGQPGPPNVGTDVRIGLRDAAVNNLLFAGTVKTLEPYYELAPKNPAWAVTCEDYTFLINRRKVYGTWDKVSASQVALDILSRFTAGFSSAGIASGLPAITVTFRGESVMDALTQIANLVGAYAGGPDYNRVVYLFVTDPRPVPDPVTATHPLLMKDPGVRQQLDLSQVRTRVTVQGASASVGGPADFNIDNRYNQLPLDDSHIFTPGTGGQVITDDAQILSYTDVVPGKLATIVKGNVAPPTGTPTPSIAPTTAGDLIGRYRWRVAFANENGETPVGPVTVPDLVCNAFPVPSATLGVNLSSAALGPLVGKYDYAVTFVTSKGETTPSARSTRTAVATAPPPLVTSNNPVPTSAAGKLLIGSTYGYQVSYVTAYGETAPSASTFYTPPPLSTASLQNFQQLDFGGLLGNASYTYGVSFVTAIGESYPPVTSTLQTASNAGTPGSVFLITSDLAGRIGAGAYAWACSYYHDSFGESFLGPQYLINTVQQNARLLLAVPGLSARADGIRIYRGYQGGNPWALNADFRRSTYPANYNDIIPQGECGNPWPIHALRGGGIAVQFQAGAVTADVVARRIYRSKANSSDLYLIAELQTAIVGSGAVTYVDAAFDSSLSARGPVVQTTGRWAQLTIPGAPTVPAPSGFVGRRIYRTKANGATYYRLADLKEMTSTSYTDTTPDESLTAEGPVNPSTAGGESHQLLSIPIGPTGTLARRIYRTVGNGVELRLLVELQDNTTTSYLDSVPDTQLGSTLAPLVHKAGAAAVLLSNVPQGPASVTKRFIYRTKAIAADGQGGSDFFYVDAINNNTDTTFVDTKADTDLGRPPVVTSTIGALAGDTSLVVASAAGWPPSGWFEADSQVVRYNSISVSGNATLGDTLTGIPPLLEVASITRSGQTATATTVANHGFTVGQRVVILGADQSEYCGTRTVASVIGGAGFTYLVNGAPASPATKPAGAKILTSVPGAITGAIAGGTTVLSVPMLVGVSGIGKALPVGSSINLWVVRDSASGQSALAALEGGDGIHEYLVTDGELQSIAACAARGDAELLAFSQVGVSVTYTTRDRKTRSGPLVSITLPTPNVSGSFRIQRVRIDQIDIAARLYPRYSVTCSTTKFSITDLLRHVVLKGAA